MLGHRRVWDEASFLPGELIVQRRTTNVGEIFEKMSDGPRYEGLISGVQGNGNPELERKIEKVGVKFCPQNILTHILDSKFNVDYDVAIKHDPT